MSERVKLLLVEDHQILREGLSALLAGGGDLDVLGGVGTSAEALQKCRELQPDIAVVDVRLADEDGIALVRRLRYAHTGLKVIMLSMFDDSATVDRALRAGAQAYVLKGGGVAALREAIAAVQAGHKWLPPGPPDRRIQQQTVDPSALSERETEVLRLVAAGFTSAQVGEQLGLATKTVQNHRARIMEKLDIRSTAALVRYALAEGIAHDV